MPGVETPGDGPTADPPNDDIGRALLGRVWARRTRSDFEVQG